MRWGAAVGCALVLSACLPADVHQAPEAVAACRAVHGPVRSIAAAVDRVNALPPSAPWCYLASLDRPLDVVASSSITSAQPADSRASPRFFVVQPELITSLVPSGTGQPLLEFGEFVDATHTLKGELKLPREGLLAASEPFTHVQYSGPATTCGLCHREERASASVPGGFVSLAFKPVTRSLVPMDEAATAHDTCSREEDPSERCLFLHALFDFGEVREGAFPRGLATFTE